MREMARGYFEGRRGKDKVALNQALRVALSGSEAVPAADEERVSFDTFLYICSLVGSWVGGWAGGWWHMWTMWTRPSVRASQLQCRGTAQHSPARPAPPRPASLPPRW